MAGLGFRTINEMVGHAEKLEARKAVDHWKAKGLDLSKILYKPDVPPTVGTYCMQKQDHGLAKAIDNELIKKAAPALERRERVVIDLPIRNVYRTVGTMLSSQISKYYDEEGLAEDTITIRCKGSAGQSFCGFGAPGLTMLVEGDANDYFCKGLSGAKVAIYPPAERHVRPRGEHPHRQRRAVRRDLGPGVRPRARGRAVLRAQQRRVGGRRGHRRPRL